MGFQIESILFLPAPSSISLKSFPDSATYDNKSPDEEYKYEADLETERELEKLQKSLASEKLEKDKREYRRQGTEEEREKVSKVHIFYELICCK